MGEQKRADHVSSSMNGCDDDDDDVPTNHGITTFFVFGFFLLLLLFFSGGWMFFCLVGVGRLFVCLFVCCFLLPVTFPSVSNLRLLDLNCLLNRGTLTTRSSSSSKLTFPGLTLRSFCQVRYRV